MRKWRPFPLPDGSYSDDTRPWSQQDVCGYLPTKAELPGARSRIKYVPCPGMEAFAAIGYGPFRGMRDVEGKLFVVAGNRLFQISTAGVAIPIGTIPGTARVSMTHNQVDGGNQLLIGTRDNSYLYDTTTDTLAATGIPLQSVDFLNQRFLGIDSQRRFWRYSGLADGNSWNDLDNESAESSPDRIVGGIVASGEWWAFGERTTEVFQNAPSGNTTFSRGVVIEKGCANAETIKRLDNSVFFLGNDSIVYRTNGYQPIPVSPKALTAEFRGCDPAKALAFTYEDNGYLIYYLTFQDGQTWGYDVTNERWHRRESYGLDRWRLNTLCKWNGDWYGGDYSNDTLYRLKWRYAYEGEAIFPRTIRTGVMHNSGNRMRVHGLKLLTNTGLPESLQSVAPAQPDGPTITGAAPDGVVGDAYTYTYTTTAGDAAIVKTRIDETALLAGLSWNEVTATISGTPTVAGSMTIVPRVIDANGLWDELTDTIAFAEIAWIATNDAGGFLKSIGTDWTTESLISTSATGKSLRYTNGRLLCIDNLDQKYSDDKGDNWSATTITSGTIPDSANPSTSVHGNDFWVRGKPWKGDGTSLSPVASLGVITPPAFGVGFGVCGSISGYVYTSTDNFATSSNIDTPLTDDVTVAVSNGSRVLLGQENSGKVCYTDDGSTFSSTYTLSGWNGDLNGGAAEGDVFVLFTKYNISTGAVLWVSTDNAVTFTLVTLPEKFYCYDVQIGGGLIVAVGELNKDAGTPRIWTAPLSDPLTWTKRNSNFGSVDTITGVAYIGSDA